MGRRIVIVGNGDMPPGAADVIDVCDYVIRFNDCRSLGAGGSRTDVVAVCNTGRPGQTMCEGRAWRESEGVRRASEIWCVRDPSKFREMEPQIRRGWPELEDFCVDYSAGFAGIARECGKSHLMISREVHDRLDAELKALGADGYVCPSSGLIAISHVLDGLNGEAEVVIAGFGHQGWSGHPLPPKNNWSIPSPARAD